MSETKTIHLVVGTFAQFDDWCRKHLGCSGTRAQADYRAFPLADVPSYSGTYERITSRTETGPVAVATHLVGDPSVRQIDLVSALMHDLRLAGVEVTHG
jgi:hypothetical protein